MAQSSKIPTNPIGLYYTYWNPRDALDNFSQNYNMFFLFHATPVGGAPGTTGAVEWNQPVGFTSTQTIAQITTVRARGQLVILSCGGAGAQILIDSQARADAFVQSIKDINVFLGGSGTTNVIDGVDFNNFEQATSENQRVFMTVAAQALKSFYGSDFIITAPPAASNFQSQNERDRLLLATMFKGDALDWFCPQFYDDDSLTTQSNLTFQMDFYNTEINVDGTQVQIPRSHIGAGFALEGVITSGRWTATTAVDGYNLLVSSGREPKGTFLFGTSENTQNDFATNVAPVINNNQEPATGGGDGGNNALGFQELTKIRSIADAAISKMRENRLQDIQGIRGNSVTGTSVAFFNETFESGSLPWGFSSVGTLSGGATATLDTGSTVVGTNSLGFTASTSGSAVAIRTIPEEVDEVYIQVRGFIPTAFDVGATDYVGFLDVRDITGSELIRFNLESSALTLSVAGAEFGPGFTSTAVSLPKNSVFRLEIYINKNDTTGNVKVWLNNTTEGSPDYDSGNVDTDATQIKSIRVGGTFLPDILSESYFIDNVKHDTAFIGTRED